MGLDDRLWWFFIGMVIGYVVHLLQSIKSELDEVDDIVKHDRNDKGATELPYVVRWVALFLVVGLTALAAFQSQQVSNDQKQVTSCNRKYLTETIVALNQRTGYVQTQSEANIRLQRDQLTFFTTILRNPANDQVELDAFHKYIASQKAFLKANRKLAHSATFQPFPTAAELQSCLE